MMGPAAERGSKLFYVGLSLEDRVPQDHLLREVDRAIDFSFVRREVAHLYGANGHVSIDPEVTLRMMLLIFLDGVRSEREFMRQLPMRLDWLWFCKMDLDAGAPDHSVLSKARRRWGEDLFCKLFKHVLVACVEAGLVDGETLHADSTLMKASADKDGRISRVLWEQMESGLRPPAAESIEDDDDDHPDASNEPGKEAESGVLAPLPLSQEPASPPRSERATLNRRLVSPTDPDAATHTRQGVGTILGYRDHRLVDDRRGIILVTHITPADGDDGAQVPLLLHKLRANLGWLPRELTGDSQYGTSHNYALCGELGILPFLKRRRGKGTPRVSWLRLLPPQCNIDRAIRVMGRRRHVAEGSFAEAHTQMDHRRCRWRRRSRVQIQAFLVATAQNLKKLAREARRAGAAAQSVAIEAREAVRRSPFTLAHRRLSVPQIAPAARRRLIHRENVPIVRRPRKHLPSRGARQITYALA